MDLFRIFFVGDAFVFDEGEDLHMFFWIGIREGRIFKDRFPFSHTESVGEARMDLECLERDAFAFCLGHILEGLNIVQAVGELDQKHAHIVRHCDKEFAETFHMAFDAVIAELAELGHAVNELKNFFPK